MPYQQNQKYRRSNNGSSQKRRPYSGGRSKSNFQRKRTNPGKKLDYRLFIKKASMPDEEVYHPVHTFDDFNISPTILKNLKDLGYKIPTPIQDQAIPQGLKGKDILGIANTGTGKTAAFLIPAIENVIRTPKTETILIIAPVRELAQQIEKELAGFVKNTKIGYVSLIGGAPIGPQIRKLERAPHFIIGTPGRITDLIDRGLMPMGHISTVVLDEVDRMLDMGFIDPIRNILRLVPKNHQSLFFSATVSPEISTLIKTFMQDYVTITVKTHATSGNVHQDVVRVGYGMNKIDVLHDLLNKPELEKVLVFGETKRGVERLTNDLTSRGFKVKSIHGDKSQGQRTRTIEDFKSGKADILVATDVAARGLDIKGITHVINYELPQSYDDYAHRIGRTGRAGKLGSAITFIEG
jgi:ATP-dependent RNA helicase RhlE